MSGLFGGGNQTIVNEDKKLAGFQVNSATYGLPVPIVFGTTRVSGNIIDYFDFTAIAHETRTESGGGGGKGGGGGVTTVNVSYTYQVGLIIGLCEGPISAVGKVWKDKEQFSSLAGLGLTLFTGALGQSPWSYVQSVHPERALPYSGLAYAAGVLDLGGSDSLPQMNYEIKGLLLATGDGIDVNPADVCEYVLSNALNGVRFSLSNIDTDSLERFWNYCYAADLLISVPLSEQKKTAELLKGICEATKTIHFWSQDKVKFVPRCDERLERSGIIYEPVTTPEYDLTADDFLEQADGRLVIFDRVDPSEAYNHVPIEFINRANEYQPELADGRIEVDINRRGMRSAPVKKIPFLHTKDRAEYVAELEVMGYLYSRNKYTFRLGWMHCLLEPGDFVTLTEATIGLDEQPAIMDSIEEDADGALTCVAYGRQPGIYNPAKYGTQAADRPSVDYNADPGNPINPVIFELPAALSGGVMKTYIAAAGGENWGGAHVWISSYGDTYKRIGTITNPSRYGELRETMPTGSAVDTVNALKIDLADSKAVLNSATQDDADNKRTLCWVDGELIAYQTATLTGTDEYDLTYLVRGCYGTPISEHAAGSRFVRVDENVLFGYPYAAEDVGKTFYIKLLGFNIYGSAIQDLNDVTAYSRVVEGIAPPSIESFSVSLSGAELVLTWTPVSSIGITVDGYKISRGETAASGQLVNIVAGSNTSQAKTAALRGTNKYWIVAYNQYGESTIPAGDSITLTSIPTQNYVDEQDNYEETGAVSGSGMRFSGLVVQGASLAWSVLKSRTWADFKATRLLGPTAGAITVTGETVDIGKSATVLLSVLETWLRAPDVANIWQYRAKSNVEADWSNWALLPLGEVAGRYWQFQLTIGGVNQCGILESANVVIDVPDQEFPFKNIEVPIGGIDIVFEKTFVQRPIIFASPKGGVLTPKITPLAGDDDFLTGFHLELWSGPGTEAGGVADASAKGF